MHKILKIAIAIIAMYTTVSFAAALRLYEKPDKGAKVVATLESGAQLMPIFYTEKGDWVKVANPQNGDVGWAQVDELKGPMVITQINGAETRQQIIVEKDKQPQVYSIIQYSSPQKLQPAEAKKLIQDMEKRNKDMQESMQKMQEQMQKIMSDMFKGFDKSFYTFPIIQPIIVVPDSAAGAAKPETAVKK